MNWVRGSIIGQGSSSVVHLAFHRSYPLATFAVKSSPLSSAFLLQREEAILIDLQRCPQIISCFGHDITVDLAGSRIDRIYNIFLEYAGDGSISDTIRRASRGLPEPTIHRYLRSILLGLRHIHAMGYVHCDIKPENILIVGGEAKIADFGLAKKVTEEFDEEIRGTPMYMAPESISRKEYEAAADIWAFGCTVTEMVSGRSPWQCVEESENGIWTLLMRIGSGDELPEIPLTMSEEGKDFLRCCFEKDPGNRWTAGMLLSHPFVAFSSKSEPQKEAVVCSNYSYTTPRSLLGYSFSSIQVTLPRMEVATLFPLELDEDWTEERVRGLASVEERLNSVSTSPKEGWIILREESTSGTEEDEGEDIIGMTRSCIGDTVELEVSSPQLVSISREFVRCRQWTQSSIFRPMKKRRVDKMVEL